MTSVDLRWGTFYNQGGLPYSTRAPHELRTDILNAKNEGQETENEENISTGVIV
jgi:hypothetical protein